jgi:hypothetical protein
MGVSVKVGERRILKDDIHLKMTEPLHGTGKVVATGDSGFCVAKTVMALNPK